MSSDQNLMGYSTCGHFTNMAAVYEDLKTDTKQAIIFPILEVSAEIRAMIYSYIILPPNKRSDKTNTYPRHSVLGSRVDVRVNAKYYDDRRIWHETAQSLLRTCRQVNLEATPYYWANKTLVVAKAGHELSMLRSATTVLNRQLKFACLSEMCHLEFDIQLTHMGSNEKLFALGKVLPYITKFLYDNVRYLPRLRTVNIRVAQDIDILVDSLGFDLDLFNVRVKDSSRRLAVLDENMLSWEFNSIYREADALYAVEEMDAIFQYAHGMGFGVLSGRNWACTRSLCKTWGLGAALLYEMKFERRNCERKKYREIEEEEARNVSDEVSVDENECEWRDVDDETLDATVDVIQSILDDYDMGYDVYDMEF